MQVFGKKGVNIVNEALNSFVKTKNKLKEGVTVCNTECKNRQKRIKVLNEEINVIDKAQARALKVIANINEFLGEGGNETNK